MTAKTLEEEARKAAEKYRVSCGLDAVGEGQLTHEVIGYAQGFFDAAAARNKEIEELRDEAERLRARCALLKHALKLTQELLNSDEKEIETLRARVKELEGMVPRCVEDDPKEVR